MMRVATLGQLALKHSRNAVAERLYRTTGLDVTRPVAIYGLVNQHCNAKCLSCKFWRMDEYAEEMSIEQWQNAMLSLKEFIGKFSVNFSGGEPFLKKDFVALLEFCSQHGILAGATTNGSCFTPELTARLVAARPFNINISVDAPHAELHDHLRGMTGLFERICAGIGRLAAEQAVQNVSFPIIIKPTINAENFRLLPELVEWAGRLGATSVHFQPLERWTPETYDELWIGPAQLADFERVIERLLAMKREGAPILNTERSLGMLGAHFREEKAPPDMLPCVVGMRNYFIGPDGDVKVCGFFPPLGNVRTQPAREIWHGQQAREVRRQTLECQSLCLATCTSQKTLRDKFRMAWQLLRGQRHRGNGVQQP
jgi:radical SAM protein with 4Fe4S-binding SPASM domain